MREERAGDRGSEVKAWASLELGGRAAAVVWDRARGRERLDCRHRAGPRGGQETTGHSGREGRAHEGRRRRMKGQTPLHPDHPQHPSGQTHSASLVCWSPPSLGLPLGKTGRGQEGSCLNPRGQALSQLGFCWAPVVVKFSRRRNSKETGVCWWRGHPCGRLASVLGPEEPGGGTHLA